MSEKRYVVELSEAERQELLSVIKARRMSAEKRVRAQILLMVDQGQEGAKWTDEQAAEAYGRRVETVAGLRKRLVERGFRDALERKAQVRPSRVRKLDEEGERELVALAQSEPPEGRARWTLHLLAQRLVVLKVVPSISHETVRKGLKKTNSNHTFRPDG
jgi:transposase